MKSPNRPRGPFRSTPSARTCSTSCSDDHRTDLRRQLQLRRARSRSGRSSRLGGRRPPGRRRRDGPRVVRPGRRHPAGQRERPTGSATRATGPKRSARSTSSTCTSGRSPEPAPGSRLCSRWRDDQPFRRRRQQPRPLARRPSVPWSTSTARPRQAQTTGWATSRWCAERPRACGRCHPSTPMDAGGIEG